MVRKITSKEREELRRIRLKGEKLAQRNMKALIKPYRALSKAINEATKKADDIEGLKETVGEQLKLIFKTKLEQQLLFIYKTNFNEMVNYFVEVLGRNINNDKIKAVKFKLLKTFTEKYMAKKVTGITKTTEKILNNRISKLSNEGKTFKEIVKNIVAATDGEIGKVRAELIAREETAQTISVANHKTAQEAKLKMKKWVHRGGGKIDRKSHLAMDGVTTGINKLFKVPSEGKTPGVSMRFPKDPECSVGGQIINCFCSCIYSRR